jgi:hypothetical protein
MTVSNSVILTVMEKEQHGVASFSIFSAKEDGEESKINFCI